MYRIVVVLKIEMSFKRIMQEIMLSLINYLVNQEIVINHRNCEIKTVC